MKFFCYFRSNAPLKMFDRILNMSLVLEIDTITKFLIWNKLFVDNFNFWHSSLGVGSFWLFAPFWSLKSQILKSQILWYHHHVSCLKQRTCANYQLLIVISKEKDNFWPLRPHLTPSCLLIVLNTKIREMDATIKFLFKVT